VKPAKNTYWESINRRWTLRKGREEDPRGIVATDEHGHRGGWTILRSAPCEGKITAASWGSHSRNGGAGKRKKKSKKGKKKKGP